nr:hypothetical protein [Streptomyces geranii]
MSDDQNRTSRARGGQQYVAVVRGDPVVHLPPALSAGRRAGRGVERLGVAGEADRLLHQALVAPAVAAEVAFHERLLGRDQGRSRGKAVDDHPGGLAGAAQGGHVHLVDAYAGLDQRGDAFGRLFGLFDAEVGEGGVQPSSESVLLIGARFAVADEVERHVVVPQGWG